MYWHISFKEPYDAIDQLPRVAICGGETDEEASRTFRSWHPNAEQVKAKCMRGNIISERKDSLKHSVKELRTYLEGSIPQKNSPSNGYTNTDESKGKIMDIFTRNTGPAYSNRINRILTKSIGETVTLFHKNREYKGILKNNGYEDEFLVEINELDYRAFYISDIIEISENSNDKLQTILLK